MKLTCTITSVFIYLFSLSQPMPIQSEKIDEQIEYLMTQFNAVGLAVAIVKDDEVIYSKGFGYRDLEHKLPADEHTVFHIASMSKAFTGSLLGILESEDKLSLKHKPAQYIPNFEFYNDKMNNLITIEDLLSHRSGLGNHGSSIVMFPDKNKLKTVQRIKYLKPQGEVKNSWLYSNIAYTLAGTVVEQVTDKSWDENLKEKIFDPLQMNVTVTTVEEMMKGDNYSLGYARHQGKTVQTDFENYYSWTPAGAIKSSVSDLSNWMRIWLNQGKYNKEQIIPQKYIRSASRMQNIKYDEEYEEGSFLWGEGFGWRLRAWNGYYRMRHGGNTNGFSTLMDLFPIDGIGIVVLTNQKSSYLPYAVSDYISRELLGLPEIEFPVIVHDIYQPTSEHEPLNADQLPTHDLNDFTGSYKAKGYGEIEIIFEEERLYAIFPTYRFVLEHLNYNSFYLKGLEDFTGDFNPEFDVKFTLNVKGEIMALEFHALNEPIVFSKDVKANVK